MPTPSSPGSSPPPSAPQTTTIEPGPRATALQKIYTSALQSTLKANSYPNFASCFPTPAKYCPTALEGVWRQLNTRLEEECQKDFEKILEERKTVEGLNTLDTLITQARERKDRGVEGEEPLALHTLTAQQLGEARMYSLLATSSRELEGKLQATQQDNQQIMEGVMSQRNDIEKIVASLEALVGDLAGAVQKLESIDGHELKKDIWDMEQEIKAAS